MISEQYPGQFLYNQCWDDLNDYHNQMKQIKTTEKKIELLEEVYQYIKEVTLQCSKVDLDYLKRLNTYFGQILNLESYLPKDYIIKSETYFDLDKDITLPQGYDAERLLSYLINETKKRIYYKTFWPPYKGKYFDDIDLEGKCFYAGEYIFELCKKLGVKAQTKILFPGFDSFPYLFEGGKQHCFNIVNFENKDYIVDCTYRQFFTLQTNLLQRIGVCTFGNCKAGIYMMMEEKRYKVAEKILKDGWIELTDENLKAYLDGFAISYRNGLYYESTNDFSYTTNYTADDYRKFLFTNDNQLNYEKEEHLGYQMKPLQNPKLSFKKR